MPLQRVIYQFQYSKLKFLNHFLFCYNKFLVNVAHSIPMVYEDILFLVFRFRESVQKKAPVNQLPMDFITMHYR
jgi:hypothetical protein